MKIFKIRFVRFQNYIRIRMIHDLLPYDILFWYFLISQIEVATLSFFLFCAKYTDLSAYIFLTLYTMEELMVGMLATLIFLRLKQVIYLGNLVTTQLNKY